MIEVCISIKAVSVANLRLHWAAKAKLAKSQRVRTKAALEAQAAVAPFLPLTIVLTRVGPRTLDTDNLASSLKAVRDGVADWIGVDDGDPRLDWQYQQRKGDYAVEIEIL